MVGLLSATLAVMLLVSVASAAQVSADKAEAAKRRGDPDWRAKGLSCHPKTWITAAQYQATCGRQPKPGLRYVCPF